MVYVAGRRFIDRAPEERNITVYTNCDEVTLIVNGVETETKTATDHAVVFENVVLNNGINTIAAKSGNLEDTITLNGVDEHNADYTIPDLAEALQIGNWFDGIADDSDSDEIEIIDGYYSIDDTLEVLLSNEECLKTVKGWCMKHGDLTGVSTLTALRDMVGFVKIDSPIIPLAKVYKQQYAQLNRQLNKIKK